MIFIYLYTLLRQHDVNVENCKVSRLTLEEARFIKCCKESWSKIDLNRYVFFGTSFQTQHIFQITP